MFADAGGENAKGHDVFLLFGSDFLFDNASETIHWTESLHDIFVFGGLDVLSEQFLHVLDLVLNDFVLLFEISEFSFVLLEFLFFLFNVFLHLLNQVIDLGNLICGSFDVSFSFIFLVSEGFFFLLFRFQERFLELSLAF